MRPRVLEKLLGQGPFPDFDHASDKDQRCIPTFPVISQHPTVGKIK